MKWLRRFIHLLAGKDRYHEQANEVNNRGLRAELLARRLQVIERRVESRHD